MCSQIVHIIVIIYQKIYVKNNLNTTLTSKFQSYLLPTFIINKIIGIFYSIYPKPNGRLDGFIFILKSFFIFFLCECQKLPQLQIGF